MQDDQNQAFFGGAQQNHLQGMNIIGQGSIEEEEDDILGSSERG